MNNITHQCIALYALAGIALQPLVINAAEQPSHDVALHAVQEQWGLLNEYCVSCHNAEDWAGSLAITQCFFFKK